MRDVIFEQVRGLDQIKGLIGSSLTCINRYILSFGVTNDSEGHGITELCFGQNGASIYPGQNEDFIEIREGFTDVTDLSMSLWTKIALSESTTYSKYLNKPLSSITILADSGGDRALILAFGSSEALCIYYKDTDLCVTDGSYTDIIRDLKERVKVG